MFEVKKLASTLSTSLLMTETSMEDNLLGLDQVLCIHYPVEFKNNDVWALINSGNEINAMI